MVLFAQGGMLVALLLAASVDAPVGPFDTTMRLRPAVRGSTTLEVAPLGSLAVRTHTSPMEIQTTINEIRLEEAKRFVDDPSALAGVRDDVTNDARRALNRLAVRALLVAAAGGAVGALVRFPRLWPVLAGAGSGVVVTGLLAGWTVATWRPEALAEPRYSGLLTVAPTAVGDVVDVGERYSEYRKQLTKLIGNVAGIYEAAQGLPVAPITNDAIVVLHVSDIHLNPQAFDLIEKLVQQFDVDVVADTGDLTDWGTPVEGRLVDRIGALDVPYVWVRGNHDSGDTQRATATQPNAVVLDGNGATVAGLRFWGIGDPRFTPDKSQPVGKEVERAQVEEFAPLVARRLRSAGGPKPDVVLVHDFRAAARSGGLVPLILAGHTHSPKVRRLGTSTALIEGSTGGGGFRGLEGGEVEPLTASVLYFDRSTRRAVAVDRVSLGGLGQTSVRIQRHVLAQVPERVAQRGASGSFTTNRAPAP